MAKRYFACPSPSATARGPPSGIGETSRAAREAAGHFGKAPGELKYRLVADFKVSRLEGRMKDSRALSHSQSPNAGKPHGFRAGGVAYVIAALLMLGAFSFESTAPAQGGPRGPSGASPELRAAIAGSAAKYKIPGIAAAIFQHGQLTAIEVTGVRDLKSNAPVTAGTIFEPGSLGEPVYAYAVVLLGVAGRFNLAAPLTTYLPPPYVRYVDGTSSSPGTEPLVDQGFAQVTALQVMSHTSGMPDWARNQHLRFQSAPGQRWSYSNEGYIYLQHAVERVTGQTFDDFVSEAVLRPSGMGRSRFSWDDSYAGEIATGYDASGAPVAPQRYARPAAATSLYTTIQDYARFVQRLLASAPAQRAHEAAVTEMLNATTGIGGGADSSLSWGLGVGLEKRGNDLFFFERGGNEGFQSFLLASRKTGDALVILTNSDNGFRAVPDIVAATLGGDHPAVRWPPSQTP